MFIVVNQTGDGFYLYVLVVFKCSFVISSLAKATSIICVIFKAEIYGFG